MDPTSLAQLMGNLGEFVGAIAVVTTLVYLTIQVRQNTEAIRFRSGRESARLSADIALALMQPSASMVLSAEAARRVWKGASRQYWSQEFCDQVDQIIHQTEAENYFDRIR